MLSGVIPLHMCMKLKLADEIQTQKCVIHTKAHIHMHVCFFVLEPTADPVPEHTHKRFSDRAAPPTTDTYRNSAEKLRQRRVVDDVSVRASANAEI